MIIGVGTGRSGTLTLALLLDGCQGIRCIHEATPLLPWEPDQKAYRTRLREITEEHGRADVASSLLPYCEWFIRDVRDVRIVATRRDLAETARSFEAYMGPTRNHWLDHQGVGWELDPTFDDAYPKYDIEIRYEAILRYCVEYNEEVDRLRRKYPGRVLVVATEDLGKISTQQRIYDHCNIPESDRCYNAGARHNQRPQKAGIAVPFDLADMNGEAKAAAHPLYIGTYRKRKHIEDCLQSVDRYLTGYDDLIFLDDSGDRLHTKWLLQYGQVIALPNVGHTVALRALCAHANGLELFWLEEDFVFTAPVSIEEMSEHLYHRPYLAQVAVLREPLWGDEKRLGGVLEAQAANGFPVHKVGDLWEQTAWFTLNPSLWRRHISELGWPNPKRGGYSSEWVKSKELRELMEGENLPRDWIPPIPEKEPPRGYKFGYLPGVRCRHNGAHEGKGY